jgi:hypothetical protein
MSFRNCKGLLLTLLFALAAELAWPANSATSVPEDLTAAQIVQQIQQHNQSRADELKHYQALRHYQVEYTGFSRKLGAKMDVEVNYDQATGKSFRIVSESGSGLLREKVLKRAVDSEKEASQIKGSSALTEANYRFHMAGTETVAERPAYILDVEPRVASKFLVRGKIWVDAADFAVVRMETEPAKSPSFWIARTLIHSTSAKTGDFWLPEQLRSETRVRIGGTAVLTIDYGSYETAPAWGSQGTGPH